MYSSWKFLIDCSFKYPTCLSFHPQFLAMGASSVFILLLSGAVTFPSSLLFVCAAIGLCTFTSGYVTVGKILSVCLKETFYLKMKIQSLSSRLHADGKSGESPEALRSQMNLRRCYLQPLHMLRAYWGLFPAADEYTFGALVVVMKEYVAQCSSVALLCVVNSFFLQQQSSVILATLTSLSIHNPAWNRLLYCWRCKHRDAFSEHAKKIWSWFSVFEQRLLTEGLFQQSPWWHLVKWSSRISTSGQQRHLRLLTDPVADGPITQCGSGLTGSFSRTAFHPQCSSLRLLFVAQEFKRCIFVAPVITFHLMMVHTAHSPPLYHGFTLAPAKTKYLWVISWLMTISSCDNPPLCLHLQQKWWICWQL